MTRSNTEWAILAVTASLKSGRRNVMTIGSLKEAGIHEASKSGHPPPFQSAVELGVIHLELNGLVEVGYKAEDDISPVRLSAEWISIWEQLCVVEAPFSPGSSAWERELTFRTTALHAAQISRLRELVVLSPFPTEHQVSVLANNFEIMVKLKGEETSAWKDAVHCLQEQLSILKLQEDGDTPPQSREDEYLALGKKATELKTKAVELQERFKAIEEELRVAKEALTPQRL